MRILLTTDTIGGVWTFTRELATGLLEQGCPVALFSLGRMPSLSQRQWASRMEQAWNPDFRFQASSGPLEWMQENAQAYLGAEPELLALIDTFRPDVIHTSQFCFGALPVDLPKVITAHSDVLSWAAACRQQPLPETPWLTQYVALVRRGLAAADAVVGPTHWMLAALRENFALPARQHVIANGRTVTVANAAPRTLQAVTAGRLWDEGKNIRLLLDVTTSVPILVAGERMHSGAASPATLGHARFLGALDEAATLLLFRQSSIYLCLSLYEPFGLAPLEAALCGCAVLAHDIASLREVWGHAALYFKDAASLSASLEHLAANPAQLGQAQARAYARAQHFSRASMTAQYRALYEQCRAGRQGLRDVA